MASWRPQPPDTPTYEAPAFEAPAFETPASESQSLMSQLEASESLAPGEAAGDVGAVDLDLASLAVRIMDVTKQDVREVADEEGLSIAQLDVLRRLRNHGPTPMRRLAEQMNCEASNLTGLVDRLEARGLVERRPDPGDRRVRLLALTGEGTRVSQASWVAVARRCSLTSLAPEQRVQLAQLLRAALRHADAHIGSA